MRYVFLDSFDRVVAFASGNKPTYGSIEAPDEVRVGWYRLPDEAQSPDAGVLSLTLSGPPLTLTVNVTPVDADQGVAWSSSDVTVVTVDPNGSTEAVVTPVALGTATITVVSASDPTKSATFPVKVTSPVEITGVEITAPAPAPAPAKFSPLPPSSSSSPSMARLKTALLAAAQNRLDAFAKTRGYKDIAALCTYADSSPHPLFRQEGQRGVQLRDATWTQCYQMLEQIETGKRVAPELDKLLAELPKLTWD